MGPQGAQVPASFLSVPGTQVPTLSLALTQEREEEASKHCLQSWLGCGHAGLPGFLRILGEQTEDDGMGSSFLGGQMGTKRICTW